MILCRSRAQILLLLLGLSTASIAQEKCGTVEFEKITRAKHPTLETSDHFEKWMQSKLSQLKLKRALTGRIENPQYTIPLVVHIIHNGEPVGTGTNLSDAQIQSQITVLNQDYPRLNPDRVNTLADFVPVAGGIDIQFVLAKQDPEGLPTNGITRTKGSKASWKMTDNSMLKAQSYWDANNYLNIWIVNFDFSTSLIGYAQLPVSSLAGLESASNDPLTDGVVIDYRAFGTGNPNLYPEYNLGRTATHEIGHILGLRHIWGDDGSACTGSDYCDDTPNQGDSNNGHCPNGVLADACSASIMYQNYMDYTDDACMNLFSQDQVDRMVVVLANSPRRNSLLTSPGAIDPTQVANDLGIRRIASPGTFTCADFSPTIVVRNYGSNSISSAQIQFTLNGTVTETKDITFSPTLTYLDSSVVTFLPVSLAPASSNTFNFQILLTNGVTDGKSSNNQKTQTAVVPAQGTLPLFEAFNSLPAGWSIINLDSGKTWQNVPAINSNAGNTAMYMNFFDYDAEGETDQLISPSFDFTPDTIAVLKFDRSYALYPGSTDDRLRVVVFTGCNYDHGVEIFNKSGAALATAPNNTTAFAPTGSADWATETIPLTQFLGQQNVRIAFIATNGYGNNLYLDNVRIITGSYADIALLAVKNPGPVICVNNPSPVITVRNDGTTVINSFTVLTSTGKGQPSSQTISGINLVSGQQGDFTLKPWSLPDGTSTLTITLQITDDALPIDNSIVWVEIVDHTQDVIPIRENFDSNFPDWKIVSQNSQLKWTAFITNDASKDISLLYKAITNLNIGSQSWLVSPVLDFSKTGKSSLFFDLSYSHASSKGAERLQILGSTDCGQTYSKILYDKTGDQFKNSSTSTAWAPQTPANWTRTYVNLDSVAGDSQVRIAFLVTNENGNNLYIDNVEIFADDASNPATIETDHQVYYESDRTDPRVVFNLEEKQTVRIQLLNTLGQMVSDEEIDGVLNQTYHFNTNGKPGIYIARIQIGGQFSSTKIFIPN